MQIITKKLSDLRPYARNPRKNDQAVDAVANSIREFGFKVPIVIDKNGEIIAGHTRYKAAKKMNLEEIPCIIADDLTEEQIKAFRLADNKVGELADWDFDLLSDELNEITDIDMNEFGFLENMNQTEEANRKDISDALRFDDYKLIVEGTEEELNELYDKLISEGWKCMIST